MKASAMTDKVVKAAKNAKNRKLRVTVFPEGGGQPYVVDVEPDEEGFFSLSKDSGREHKVGRGTVWDEGGQLRTILHEGSVMTVSASSFGGDSLVHPVVMHTAVRNNLMVQVAEIGSRKSLWRQASTWTFILIGVVAILVMVWQATATSGGLEEVAEALRGLQFAQQPTPPAGSGHQPIAPGGP